MIDNPYLGSSAVFLIESLFGLVILVLLLRLLLQWVRADFRNPVSQFLVKVSNPLVIPLRRVIPSLGGLDLATVLLLLLFQAVEVFLVHLAVGKSMGLASLGVMILAELISLMLNVWMVSILLEAILSWFGPPGGSPITGLLARLNGPVLSPLRRVIPQVSGIDLSPLAALLLIGLAKTLIVWPLEDLARALG